MSLAVTGLITALPFIAAVIGMLTVGRHSDLRQERHFHLIGSQLLAALGFVGSALATDPTISLIAIGIGAIGIWLFIRKDLGDWSSRRPSNLRRPTG